MTFDDLRHVESLARIADQFDHETPPTRPSLWGPASWWRMGLVVFAALIATFALWQTFS